MSTTRPHSWVPPGYLPALDGLRGVAVLAVLLFHGGVGWARGGFLGVDVFFCLSGFLITTLLLAERQQTGRVRLPTFWARRARRLLPALLLVLAAVAAAAPVLDPEVRRRLAGDTVAALLYVANWRLLGGGDYFAQTAPPSPLQHTWSLAIEEQFYLLWPLLVVAGLGRGWGLRRLAVYAAGGAAASAALMASLASLSTDPSRGYYGTDTRAQALLAGCAVAIALAVSSHSGRTPGRRAQRSVQLLALGGAVGLLVLMSRVGGEDAFLYRGGFTLTALAAAAVIAAVATGDSGVLVRVLSWAPLRSVGLVSYGLYLWHWPLYQVLTSARTGLHGPGLLATRLAATLAAATLSYRLVEQPIRRGALGRRPALLALAAATTAVLAAASVAGRTALPLDAGTSAVSEFGDVGGTDASTDPAGAGDGDARGIAPAAALPPRPARAGTARPHRTTSGRSTISAFPAGAVRVLLLGDSVSRTLGLGLSSVDQDYGVVLGNEAVIGCGLLLDGPYRYFGSVHDVAPSCARRQADWAELVRREDPDVVALLVGRWEVMDRVHNGAWSHIGDPAFDAYITGSFERVIPALTAGGRRLVLLTAPYFLRGERPDGGRWPEDDPARVDAWNALLRSVADRHRDRVSVVELGAELSPEGRYTRSVGGLLLRYDGVHITTRGGRWVAPWLLPQLAAARPR